MQNICWALHMSCNNIPKWHPHDPQIKEGTRTLGTLWYILVLFSTFALQSSPKSSKDPQIDQQWSHMSNSFEHQPQTDTAEGCQWTSASRGLYCLVQYKGREVAHYIINSSYIVPCWFVYDIDPMICLNVCNVEFRNICFVKPKPLVFDANVTIILTIN